MKRENNRIYIFIALIIVLFLSLCVRLFMLTVVQHERWANAATSQSTKEIVSSAPRGKILDRYGRVLAGNEQVFTVTMNVSGLSTREINLSAYYLIQLFEKNGDTYVDNFPILISKDGEFSFKYDNDKEKYFKKLGLSSDATAEDILNKYRDMYDIDPDYDRYQAVEFLEQNYSIWPPISVRSMTLTYDNKRTAFLEKYGLDKEMSAELAFRELRKKYKLNEPIDESGKILSDEEARKVFCIREEIKNTGYLKYRSSTIATKVSSETVAYVEEMGLKGIEIASETTRIYPYGQAAAHILGYMGSISDSQYNKYVNELGYSSDDLIGKDGLEATMESYLHGTDGLETIIVNSAGDYIETISQTEQKAGQDVYTTIDIDLQIKAEDVLERAIRCVATGSIFESEYGNIKLTKYENCASGATVVVDVETGEVLAMANYPDYDPGIFAEGISTSDWASVQSTNPRDSLAPTPLYNIAAKTAVQPGSTFKPVTAVAALQCGLDANKLIRDGGYIEVGNRKFGCSSWNNYRSTHGMENLIQGIQNSCNYYFYCIATGIDWNTNSSLRYKENITIEKIMNVASEFGLGEKTGVELYETTTPLASKEGKMASMKTSLYYQLLANAVKYWPKSTYSNDEKLKEEINTICGWIEENPSRAEVSTRIAEQTTVKKSKVEALTDYVKYSFFNLAEWTVGDEFNIAIGQGDNSYTPLQMARYVATLGNNGLRNKLTIVRGIEDEDDYRADDETYQIDVTEKEISTVLEGMRRVVTNGTLASTFRGFPISVAGKTGTAQKDGYINPKDEVAYLKENLSNITDEYEWEDVEKKMAELMKSDPKKYATENDTVDKALIELSEKTITQSDINQFKEQYDNFAWTVTLAPANDPKIAVVTLLVQGGISSNAAVVNRELIAAYLLNDSETDTMDFETKMN